MHACPCCGFRTLPSRVDYELCPVCWWEDDGIQPWEFSGPNNETLIDAQLRFLADDRPYRRRPGKVRAPRRSEARAPDWRPIEVTEELMARARKAVESERREAEVDRLRTEQEIADNPEGPFKEYNAAIRILRDEAADRSYAEILTSMREIGIAHDVVLPERYLELSSRQLIDEWFYQRHPLHAVWWLVRHGRPGTYRRRWRELRNGTFLIAA